MAEPTPNPEPPPCVECEGRQGRVMHLPGDGTACLEEFWMPCNTCDPDYYKRGRS